MRKHALGDLHPSTARIYNNIGCVHVEFDELREARRAFEAALDVQRNALCHDPESGPIQFAAATTLCNLGYLYRNRDMHEKAALVLREALSVSQAIVDILLHLLLRFSLIKSWLVFDFLTTAPRERIGATSSYSLVDTRQPCRGLCNEQSLDACVEVLQ